MDTLNERADQLFDFIETDATEKTIAILEERVDFSVIKNGNSALHYATRERHLEIVELLINKGADPNIDNQEGNTALHIAVKFHPMHLIERLITLKMNVNHTNGKGETPLHTAALHNRREAVEALLMNGANPALKDKSGKTPEEYAKDPDLAHQIRTYSELPVAMQSGWHDLLHLNY
ncbi:hypothetical protein CHS0354_014305 [Potamilus streckersoni]|uniref:Ankyrin repeat protein n=1 Tax=Potamilus streckersoni TaxID=2493646 RepID=A0AAE0SKK4_9BIVA|nr:hypothetical protein CHS0354_014305 [Potamilus streckersoni]